MFGFIAKNCLVNLTLSQPFIAPIMLKFKNQYFFVTEAMPVSVVDDTLARSLVLDLTGCSCGSGYGYIYIDGCGLQSLPDSGPLLHLLSASEITCSKTRLG